MHDFTVTLNSQAIVLDYDDMSNILGYDRSEIIGKNWFDVFINEMFFSKNKELLVRANGREHHK